MQKETVNQNKNNSILVDNQDSNKKIRNSFEETYINERTYIRAEEVK